MEVVSKDKNDEDYAINVVIHEGNGYEMVLSRIETGNDGSAEAHV